MQLLKNERIALRALEPEDLDLLYRWENDAAHWKSGSALSPYSRYALKQYIAEAGSSLYERRQLRLMIDLCGKTTVTVGIVDLYDFDPHHLRAETGILIDPAYRQQKLATDTLKLMAHYAFTFLKIHQLYAYVPQSNTPSLRLFARCGFRTAAVLKEWLVATAGYEDVALLTLLNDSAARTCRTSEQG